MQKPAMKSDNLFVYALGTYSLQSLERHQTSRTGKKNHEGSKISISLAHEGKGLVSIQIVIELITLRPTPGMDNVSIFDLFIFCDWKQKACNRLHKCMTEQAKAFWKKLERKNQIQLLVLILVASKASPSVSY